jgi:hypothetical protein
MQTAALAAVAIPDGETALGTRFPVGVLYGLFDVSDVPLYLSFDLLANAFHLLRRAAGYLAYFLLNLACNVLCSALYLIAIHVCLQFSGDYSRTPYI